MAKWSTPFELELLPIGADLKQLNPGWQIGGDYKTPGEAESALISRIEQERGWMAARIRQYGPTESNRANAHLFGKFLINGGQIKRVG